MTRFVVGEDRSQSTLFPERLEDYLSEDNPVRAIDVFVDELDLARLGFGGVEPEATGRPAYHPATLLKIYVYGYLNRVQSSRRLERECQRNIELVWLTVQGRSPAPLRAAARSRHNPGSGLGPCPAPPSRTLRSLPGRQATGSCHSPDGNYILDTTRARYRQGRHFCR
jgi:hypothetical protein